MSTGFRSGAREGRKIGEMFLGMSSLLVVCHPALSSSKAACPLGDVARDFVEVKLHHVGVGVGERRGRSDTPRWTDRAEQIGVVVAADRLAALASSHIGPLADQAVNRCRTWTPIPRLISGGHFSATQFW